MKKLFFAAIVLILIFSLSACGMSVDLLPEASPETSGLGIYSYESDGVTLRYLFGTDDIKDILKDFNGITAKKADIDKTALSVPFYGMEIGGKDGFTVYGLWSDGYFIHEDGSVYEFDYDFEKLLNENNFEVLGEFDSLSVMPLAHYVAKQPTAGTKNF